mmetsp:Transcript_8284/g.12670  ORF Transcript_8284/g.12670 Transcript_8284/m.12670 type:complete len:88 (+) Transcript_8284:413-676(+)
MKLNKTNLSFKEIESLLENMGAGANLSGVQSSLGVSSSEEERKDGRQSALDPTLETLMPNRIHSPVHGHSLTSKHSLTSRKMAKQTP